MATVDEANVHRDETHRPGYNRFSFRYSERVGKVRHGVNRSRVLVIPRRRRHRRLSRRFNRVKDIDPQVKAEHVHEH